MAAVAFVRRSRVLGALLAAVIAVDFTATPVSAQSKPGPMQSGQHVNAPAQSPAAPKDPAGPAAGAGDPAEARRLFATSCGWCHFKGGREAGKGPKLMDSELSDAQLITKIRNGKIGQMPAFGTQLSEAQLQSIVAYIRALKPE